MKINNLLMGIAMLATTAACSSELDTPAINGDGEEVVVTYSVTIPEGIKTRAFSDGTKACNLHYAVYEVGTAENTKAEMAADEGTETEAVETPLTLKLSETVAIKQIYDSYLEEFSDPTAKVNLKLVKGHNYEIAFWAQSDDAPFTYKDATQTVTYDIEHAISNNDDLDAFYAYEFVDVTCNVSKAIVLTRPFAQINIGTDDIAQAQKMGLRVDRSSITTETYTKLNLRTGKATEPEEVTFRYADRPDDAEEAFPVKGFDYISMNYILVPEEKSLVDVALNVDNGKFTQKYTNIPVLRNYRTNIYGSLITNSADYSVSIDNSYSGEDNNIFFWDGVTTEVVIPDENNVIEINNEAQFARLSLAGNGGTEYYNEKGQVTIKLMTDIDLNHKRWRSIAANIEVGEGNGFCGIFDGNGHTIRNLHVDNSDTPEDDLAGLFGFVTGATIKNLTIENATITNANEGSGACSGVLAGLVSYHRVSGNEIPTTIENVTIKGNIVVNGVNGYIGGLIGRGSQCVLKNVKIEAETGSYVKGIDCNHCGGVGGYMEYGPQTDISSNINVIATNSTLKGVSVGGLFGGIETTKQGHILTNCTCSGHVTLYNSNDDNNKITLTDGKTLNTRNMSIGGLAGSFYKSYGDNITVKAQFTDCSFTGDITSYFVSGATTDVTTEVKAQNQYWKYMGWADAGTSGFKDNTEFITITETPSE